MPEFASNGKATAGVVTGVIGTSLAALLGLGMARRETGGHLDDAGLAHENTAVRHHSLRDARELMALKAELAETKAERYTDAAVLTAERERAVLAERVVRLELGLQKQDEINSLQHSIIKKWVKGSFVPGQLVMPSSSVVDVGDVD